MACLQLSDPPGFKPRAAPHGPGRCGLAGHGCVDGATGASLKRSARNGMWPPGRSVLAVGIACFTAASVAAGQPPAAPSSLDPNAALALYSEVSAWLDAGETPTDVPLPDGCFGVWVGIRLAGRPMASSAGVDISRLSGAGGNPDREGPATRVLTGAVRRAMGAALQTVAGVDDPDVQADRQQAFLESPFRTLEIDFAHSPERLRGTTLDRVLTGIRPGLDGLLLRRAGESFTLFPAELLAHDTRLAGALVAMLAQTGVATEAVDMEIANSTIRVWKFQTLHLAQATRQGPPTFLYRGSRPVPLQSIDEAEIARLGDEAAGYLIRSTLSLPDGPGRLVLLGDYAPQTDRRLQERATLAEHAFASLALLNYSEVRRGRSDQAAAARTVALALLGFLDRDESMRATAAADARTSAFVCIVARRLAPVDLDDELRALVADSTRALYAAWTPEAGFAPDLSPEDRALVAMAIGTREALDAAWASVSVELQPLAWPWLALGEVELAERSGDVAAGKALSALRERVWSRLPVRSGDASAGEDLAGALRYRPTQPPDWHAAHLVAGAAALLGSERLTPAEMRSTEVLNLQQSFRFLRQLQAREVERYRLRQPDLALGGIRTAVWDQTMPIAASTMVVLASSEMLRSLERLRASADATHSPTGR